MIEIQIYKKTFYSIITDDTVCRYDNCARRQLQYLVLRKRSLVLQNMFCSIRSIKAAAVTSTCFPIVTKTLTTSMG